MNGLFNFTIKNLKENKKRTIVTFVGIVLSCSLLFGVGLFASTYRHNLIRETIIENGSHHIEYKNIETSKIDIIKQDYNVKEVLLKVIKASGTLENDDYNTTIEVISLDKNYNDIISLIEGKMPQKENEVIVPITISRRQGIKLKDDVTINSNDKKNDYKVVGIYQPKDNEKVDYNVIYGTERMYTKFSVDENSLISALVTLKAPKKGFEKLKVLTEKLGLNFPNLDLTNSNQQVSVNTDLLALYGQISDAGVYAVLTLSLMLILTILSIICILIIYNSFSISVTERKKQLGILSSVGATPLQILKSVFLEAGIISIIAIPVGFMLSVATVSTVLAILNRILDVVITRPFLLSIHPFFTLVSLIFIIIVIFLSSLFPAMRASEVTPIEAIKLNKDILIKRKKIKTNKLISKLFGIEGDIALKNIKRHKKRYRTTVISLAVSIVLFITTSTYINAALSKIDNNYIDYFNYDVSLVIPEDDKQVDILNQIKDISEIKDIFEYKIQNLYIENPDDDVFTKEFLKVKKNSSDHLTNHSPFLVVLLSEDSYNKYAKKIGLSKDQAILINYGDYWFFNNLTEKSEVYTGNLYKENPNLTFKFCNFKDTLTMEEVSTCYYELTDLYFANVSPFTSNQYSGSLIVKEEIYHELSLNKEMGEVYQIPENNIRLELKISNASVFDEKVNRIFDKYSDVMVTYHNPKLESHQIKMAELAILFSLYSFTAFITLIGVTSVVNTINTSINLRKIEFAMLRSVGQTPFSFNKMIRLESVFLGLKSLFYGLLISFGIIYLITEIASLSYGENKIIIPFPTNHIIVCIITVFIIIFITMKYATNKLKNDNIIETIRKENI